MKIIILRRQSVLTRLVENLFLHRTWICGHDEVKNLTPVRSMELTWGPSDGCAGFLTAQQSPCGFTGKLTAQQSPRGFTEKHETRISGTAAQAIWTNVWQRWQSTGLQCHSWLIFHYLVQSLWIKYIVKCGEDLLFPQQLQVSELNSHVPPFASNISLSSRSSDLLYLAVKEMMPGHNFPFTVLPWNHKGLLPTFPP